MIKLGNGNYHPRLLDCIRDGFPNLSAPTIKHIGNLISNKIRQSHMDCYGVEISNQQIISKSGYWSYFNLEVSGITVYVAVLVD